jgi:hypothetical protein
VWVMVAEIQSDTVGVEQWTVICLPCNALNAVLLCVVTVMSRNVTLPPS